MSDEAQKPYTEGPMHSTTPVIDPGLTFASVTDKISSIVLKRKTSLAWFFGFAISFALFQLMLLAMTNLVFVDDRHIAIANIRIAVCEGGPKSNAKATPAVARGEESASPCNSKP